ncbi:MAG: hypothetical protein R2764_22345 [Bacteroidales bacterium]
MVNIEMSDRAIIFRKIVFLTYCIVAMVFLQKVGFGQDAREKSLGIEASASYDYLEDIKLHFLLSYSVKQHMPFVGFEFPISDDPVTNFGFNVGYKFFPNKNKQRFDFFFLYLLQAGSRKLYAASTVNGFSLHNLMGYGFNIHFSDKIYLVHHMAAGIENAWFNDYGSFSDLSLSFNLGFGIKIKTSKAGE